MPAALDRLALEVTQVDGRTWLSLPEEQELRAGVRLTERAWDALMAWWGRLLRGYCEGREALQAANGEAPDPAPVCRPVGP